MGLRKEGIDKTCADCFLIAPALDPDVVCCCPVLERNFRFLNTNIELLETGWWGDLISQHHSNHLVFVMFLKAEKRNPFLWDFFCSFIRKTFQVDAYGSSLPFSLTKIGITGHWYCRVFHVVWHSASCSWGSLWLWGCCILAKWIQGTILLTPNVRNQTPGNWRKKVF